MLSDPTQSEAFRSAEHWGSTSLLDFQLRVEQGGLSGPAFRSNSLSGNERNRLLMAVGDGRFSDRSLVSGVDCREDARSFALLDYDRDGRVDIALASANAPRLRLFRNQIAARGTVVSLRLRGTTSNRDACGAVVTVTTSQGKRCYRRSIGEGLSAQNSAAIRVTLAEGEQLEKIGVRWPSGLTTLHEAGGPELVLVEPEG